jgi:hypothetical protein
MAMEEDHGECRKIGGEMVVEEGVIGSRIRSPFKGRFGKVYAMDRRVTP